MSNLVLQNPPLMESTYAIERIHNVRIHRTVSGKEHRTVIGGVRKRYSVSTKLRDDVQAPAPFGGYTEREMIEYFDEVHFGEGDSFLWTPKGETAQVRVRFDGPVVIERVPERPGLWRCNFQLVTVV